jgi:hypothetical protein
MKKLLFTLVLLTFITFPIFSQVKMMTIEKDTTVYFLGFRAEQRFEKLMGIYIHKGDTILNVSENEVYFEKETYKIDMVSRKFKSLKLFIEDEKGNDRGTIEFYGAFGRYRYITRIDYHNDEYNIWLTDINTR